MTNLRNTFLDAIEPFNGAFTTFSELEERRLLDVWSN